MLLINALINVKPQGVGRGRTGGGGERRWPGTGGVFDVRSLPVARTILNNLICLPGHFSI